MKKYVFLLLSCALFSTAHAQNVVVPEPVAPDMSYPPLGVPQRRICPSPLGVPADLQS